MRIVEGGWSFEVDRALLRTNDVDCGRVVFSTPPDVRSGGPVWAACLAALGKSRSAARASEVTADEGRHASIWLEAMQIIDVAILGAERMPTDVILSVRAEIENLGVRLALVADPPALPYLLARLPEIREPAVSAASLLEEWAPKPAVSAEATTRRASRPPYGVELEHPIPVDDPVLLWGFSEVARLPRPERPTKAQAAGELRRVLEPVADPRCFAAAVTGAGLALQTFGWDLQLDRAVLARGPAEERARIDEAWAPTYRAFWIFRDPLPGALWTLTRLPVTIAQVLELRVDGVVEDGSMVGVDGEWFEMREDARPLLRAQLISRRRDGAAGNERFIVRDKGAATERWVVQVLTATAAEASVRVLDRELRFRPGLDERWLAERGVGLRWISRRERTKRGLERGGYRDLDDRIAKAGTVLLNRVTDKPHCPCALAHPPPSGVPGVARVQRCKHGLPSEVVVDDILLSHSRKLCHAAGPASQVPTIVRPAAAGYCLTELERGIAGLRVAVVGSDGATGELLGVPHRGDLVWLQVMGRPAPPLSLIGRAVADATVEDRKPSVAALI
jgi:hypothetical protein